MRRHTRYRQQRLLQRSAILRTRVATRATALAPAFEAADAVHDIGRLLRQHWVRAALIASAVGMVALRRPAAVARMSRRAVGLLPTLPYLLPSLYALLRRRRLSYADPEVSQHESAYSTSWQRHKSSP